ncbi:hypothetical protein C8R48DRAFT_675348 [Suillus tomentosus]|nr:hypothetical protein C8R48DRAFT_675348 [Suillus tomentosus]
MNQKCHYRRDFHNYEATSEGRYLPGDDYVLARAGDMPNIRRAVHHYEAMSKGQYLPVDVYMLTCVGDSFETKRTIRHLPENDDCRLSERKQIIPAKPIVELRPRYLSSTVYIQPIHITPKDPCIGTRTVFWRLFGSVMAYEHDSKKYSDRDIEVVLFIRHRADAAPFWCSTLVRKLKALIIYKGLTYCATPISNIEFFCPVPGQLHDILYIATTTFRSTSVVADLARLELLLLPG